MEFDPDKYRRHLGPLDLGKEKEDEILLLLWRVMDEFASSAFGEHTVQLAEGKRDSGARRATSEMLEFCNIKSDTGEDNG